MCVAKSVSCREDHERTAKFFAPISEPALIKSPEPRAHHRPPPISPEPRRRRCDGNRTFFMESLHNTKHSENRYKVIFHRDLPSIPADARLIEVAFSYPTRTVYTPGEPSFPTAYVLLEALQWHRRLFKSLPRLSVNPRNLPQDRHL